VRLWLLRPVESGSAFWEPWYDKAFGFVVRAETEEDARKSSYAISPLHKPASRLPNSPP
jgi:hypothetical protein